MPALFIGRFQPPHLGHIQAIKDALKTEDRLYIGVGSAENNYRPQNPFTFSERYIMIESALDAEGIPREKYAILPVRNINNYALWCSHVELCIPPFSKVYTGSDTVQRLFEDHNKNLKNPHQIIQIKKTLDISSTKVRELMLKDGGHEKLIHKSTAELLKKWDTIVRLKEIREIEK
jgi:nicotinamide-nucleotide adenylyltransferase